jgi:hypothetical protein
VVSTQTTIAFINLAGAMVFVYLAGRLLRWWP